MLPHLGHFFLSNHGFSRNVPTLASLPPHPPDSYETYRKLCNGVDNCTVVFVLVSDFE